MVYVVMLIEPISGLLSILLKPPWNKEIAVITIVSAANLDLSLQHFMEGYNFSFHQ